MVQETFGQSVGPESFAKFDDITTIKFEDNENFKRMVRLALDCPQADIHATKFLDGKPYQWWAFHTNLWVQGTLSKIEAQGCFKTPDEAFGMLHRSFASAVGLIVEHRLIVGCEILPPSRFYRVESTSQTRFKLVEQVQSSFGQKVKHFMSKLAA